MRARTNQHLIGMLALTAIVVSATGCGVADKSETKSSRPAFPMLVMMTGNKTCGEDPNGEASASPQGATLWSDFHATLGEMGQYFQSALPWVASCHDDDSQTFYMTSANPGKVIEGNYAEITRTLNAHIAKTGVNRVVMWGHSYGGWQAVNAVSAMERSIPIDLITVDPINREVCTFDDPSGCTEGLASVKKSVLRGAHDRTARWLNYYQTETWYLHSDRVSEADVNRELMYGHFDIDNTEEVWTTFRDMARVYGEY